MTLSDMITYSEYQIPENEALATLESSIEYDECLIDYLRATFEAMKCDTVVGRCSILTESLTDMTTTVVKWFRDWLSEFSKRMKTRMHLCAHKLNEFRQSIEKMDKRGIPTVNPPIMCKAFNYTIPNGGVDFSGIYEVMYETEKAVDAITNNRSNPRDAVNRVCSLIGSNEVLSRYRGKLMDKLFVSADKYSETLYKYFRGESSNKHTFIYTEDYLADMKDRMERYRAIALQCQKDKERIEKNVQDIIRYVNTQPVILADYVSIAKARALQQPYKERGIDYINGDLVDRDDTYKYLATIFSRTNATLKTLQIIYDKYLDAKMTAINEAIEFYNKLIVDAYAFANKKQSATESVVGNYLEMADEAFDVAEAEMSDIKLTLCIEELYNLGEAWARKKLVYEAPGVQVGVNKLPVTKRRTNGIFGSIKEFIRKILEYIGKILTKFNETLGELMQGEVKWIAENANYIQNVPKAVLKTMTLTYANYIHTGAPQRIAAPAIPMKGTLKTIAMDIGRQAAVNKVNGNGNYNAALDCYHKYFPELAKMNPNDWKEAATRWYRGGQNAKFIPPQKGRPGLGETVTVQGDACQDVLNAMLQYCLNYKQYADSAVRTIDGIRRAISEQERTLGQLENEKARTRGQATAPQPQVQMNSYVPVIYSMMEGDVLENTEFRSFVRDIHGFPIYEDTGDAAVIAQNAAGMMGAQAGRAAAATSAPQPQAAPQQQQQAPQQNFQQPQQPPQQQPQQQQNPAQQRQDGVNNLQQHISRSLIEAYRVCVAIGAAKLSVCEEIFKSYAKTLHQVVDEIKKFNGDQDTDQANRQYNEQQRIDQHNDHVDKMRQYQYMRRQRKARRSGLLGAMKNIIGG